MSLSHFRRLSNRGNISSSLTSKGNKVRTSQNRSWSINFGRLFFSGFGEIQKSKMAHQDGRHSGIRTQRHVTSLSRDADLFRRTSYLPSCVVSFNRDFKQIRTAAATVTTGSQFRKKCWSVSRSVKSYYLSEQVLP